MMSFLFSLCYVLHVADLCCVIDYAQFLNATITCLTPLMLIIQINNEVALQKLKTCSLLSFVANSYSCMEAKY